MLDKHLILGVHITDRATHVEQVQKLFSEYGQNIKTRLGLHDMHEESCASSCVIILELTGDEQNCHDLAAKLAEIEGVYTKEMIFDHPWLNKE